MNGRTLTDDDVQAIVDKLRADLVADFYGEIGRGAWAWIKKLILGLAFMLAVYGMSQDKGILHGFVVSR